MLNLNTLLLLIVVLFSNCAIKEESRDEVKLSLLGQSLIRHDPSHYNPDILEGLKPILREKDVVFTNLEVAICTDPAQCIPTRVDSLFPSPEVSPVVLDYLKSINVNLLSLANNHSWDFGEPGILQTLREAGQRGIKHAGTGHNLHEASAPVVLQAGNTRVALIAMSSASKFRNEAPATETKPGVNVVDMKIETDRMRMLTAVDIASNEADIVIVYQHLQGLGTLEEQEVWARELIDRGAHIFVSHGDPRLYGIEVYGNGVIFYGLGNFIFHTRSAIGHYEEEVWQSVIANINWAGREIQSVEIIPIVIDEGNPGEHFLELRGMPELADERKGYEILTRVAELSQKYNTEMVIENNKGYLKLN